MASEVIDALGVSFFLVLFAILIAGSVRKDCLDNYKTKKVVKVQDKRVVFCHCGTMIMVVIFGFLRMLSHRSYMEIEDITAGSSEDVQIAGFWEPLSWESRNRTQLPAYCTGEMNTDFWYDPTFQYTNNSCVQNFKTHHISGKMNSGLFVTTALGEPADKIRTARFIPEVERFVFGMQTAVHIRGIDTIDETMIYINGKKQPASIDEYGYLRFQIEDVLQDLGYSLDDRQDISEEDLVQHESTPDEYIGLTPHWRLTGIEIMVVNELSNIDHASHYFDFQTKNKINIRVNRYVHGITWSCLGPRLVEDILPLHL